LKYTPTSGRVAVAVNIEPDEQSGSHVTVSVRDTGPGVPPDLRDRIFDPFYRVPSSEHRVSGSGMGLAISRRIAGLLGGTVAVRDAPGGGADFVFSLPVK
jgi:two-component system, OmpR family, sensor kinase